MNNLWSCMLLLTHNRICMFLMQSLLCESSPRRIFDALQDPASVVKLENQPFQTVLN